MATDKAAIVFVHGFKGGVDTFGTLPGDLESALQDSARQYTSVVYPAWKTSGKLEDAVNNLHAWMTEQRDQHHFTSFILVAHSMGGLLACDVYLKDVSNGNTLNITAILNQDSPMIGLHPNVFANTGTKLSDYYDKFNKIKDVASGATVLMPFVGAMWGSTRPGKSEQQRGKEKEKEKQEQEQQQATTSYLKPAGAAIAAVSAVGAGAYFGRDKLLEAYRAAVGLTTDHLLFLSNLWNTRTLKERLDSVEKAPVLFRNYYTHLPHLNDRTFCLIPADSDTFIRASNSLPKDEIGAHVGMFASSSNSNYHQLVKDLVTDILKTENMSL